VTPFRGSSQQPRNRAMLRSVPCIIRQWRFVWTGVLNNTKFFFLLSLSSLTFTYTPFKDCRIFSSIMMFTGESGRYQVCSFPACPAIISRYYRHDRYPRPPAPSCQCITSLVKQATPWLYSIRLEIIVALTDGVEIWDNFSVNLPSMARCTIPRW